MRFSPVRSRVPVTPRAGDPCDSPKELHLFRKKRSADTHANPPQKRLKVLRGFPLGSCVYRNPIYLEQRSSAYSWSHKASKATLRTWMPNDLGPRMDIYTNKRCSTFRFHMRDEIMYHNISIQRNTSRKLYKPCMVIYLYLLKLKPHKLCMSSLPCIVITESVP